MRNSRFEKFKSTGKIDDYLKYVKEKKKDVELSLEKKDGIKRGNNCKNN